MKLNIVTGSSNSLGVQFLKTLANKDDVTIGLSRRGCDIKDVLNGKVDLLIKNSVQKTLIELLQGIDLEKISSVHLIHTAGKIKNEFPDIKDEKFNMTDNDADGIDDEVLHCTLSTFQNVQDSLRFILQQNNCAKTPIFLNIVCSLLDKKEWIPTSHASMIKANKLLREYVYGLCENNINYKGICVSVGTIATQSEIKYRVNADHNFRLEEKKVVTTSLEGNKFFENCFMDTDLFEFNPNYDAVYKNETDSEMTERFKREIGLL